MVDISIVNGIINQQTSLGGTTLYRFKSLRVGLNMDQVKVIWLVVSIFFPSYMGCHPKPIDELRHFSRWLVNHQPENGEDERNNTC